MLSVLLTFLCSTKSTTWNIHIQQEVNISPLSLQVGERDALADNEDGGQCYALVFQNHPLELAQGPPGDTNEGFFFDAVSNSKVFSCLPASFKGKKIHPRFLADGCTHLNLLP